MIVAHPSSSSNRRQDAASEEYLGFLHGQPWYFIIIHKLNLQWKIENELLLRLPNHPNTQKVLKPQFPPAHPFCKPSSLLQRLLQYLLHISQWVIPPDHTKGKIKCLPIHRRRRGGMYTHLCPASGDARVLVDCADEEVDGGVRGGGGSRLEERWVSA